MLRKTLLYLSEKKGLQDFLMRRKVARRVAHRFVAGETLDTAMEATRDLNARGMKVTLDHLGESVTSREQALGAANDYLEALRRIDRDGVDSGISIKLTQIGLAIDRSLCRDNLCRIASLARELEVFVRIDMESSDYTERTLDLFYEVYPEFDNLGVVIQSYLRRSADDVRRLCERGASVRLCKGAYNEPASVAFQKKRAVDENFLRLLEMLVRCDSSLAVATHDDRMIRTARRLVEGDGARRNSAFEFQMLYGVRRDLQRRLVEDGYRMRVYVPYGTEWYPYFMRRMAERPANVFFVLRALLGR